MTDDEVFRRVVIVATLLVFPMAAFFRLKAHATGERLDRRKEGWFILATLRPAGLAFLIGLVTFMIDPLLLAWSSLPLPFWMRAAGIPIWAAAAALLLWTLRFLGKNLTDTVVTRRDHTLVVDGPYRWIRHPFYCSVLLLIVACSLMAANWFLLLAGSVAFTMMVIRVRIEERLLLDRFGERYRAYRDATGAFLPRL